MKRHGLLSLFFCLPFLVLLLVGCASQDAEYIRRDINTLQRQIDDLQQEIRSSRGLTAPQEPTDLEARKGQADIEADLQNVKVNLDNLSAQIEDNQQLTTRVSAQLDSLETGFTARLDELEARLDQMTPGGEAAEVISSQPAPTSQEVKVVPPPEEVEPETAEVPPSMVSSDVERAYQDAYQAFQTGNLDQAEEKFTSFLSQYPDTPLSDNAQFWIGEISFQKHQYEAAILAYEDVIKKYPTSNKIPDAILKQGLAFLELGDRIDARIVLENLVKKYPNTEQAKIAKARLATLK